MRFCALLCALFGVLFAAEDDSEYLSLDGIVVTGTRTEHMLSDVPVRTEVIDARTLQNRHVQDAAQALALLPGVYVRQTHGKEGQSAWMQGFDSDHVLILVDGRLPIASTGSTVDLSQISIQDVERIEVVKGGTSALYGTSAMGGVVNIITKRRERPFAFSLDATGGSWGERAVEEPSYYRLAGTMDAMLGAWFLRLNADWRDDSGYADDPDGFAQQGQAVERTNLKAEAGWQTGRDRIELAVEYFTEDKYRPSLGFYPGVGYEEEVWEESVESGGVMLSGTHQPGDQKVTWQLWYQQYASTSTEDIVKTVGIENRRKAEMEYGGGELQWDVILGESHLLSMGTRLHAETLDQKKSGAAQPEIDDKSRNNIEFFVQDSWNPGASTEVLPGARWQNDSDFGPHFSPKINAMQTVMTAPVSLALRAGIGTGYRIPTLKERYFDFNQSQYSYIVIGNPDLKPESSVSYQLGADLRFDSTRSVSVNLFYNDVNNLIDTILNPVATEENGMDTYDYRNIGRATMKGVEVDATWMWNNFIIKGGYTWLDAIDEETGLKLTDRPEHQFKGSMEWYTGPLTFVVLGMVQSSEYVDEANLHRSKGYGIWDVKATWASRHGYEVYGGVDNLFDVHQDPDDDYDLRPSEGRFVYLGIRLYYEKEK